jgi:hypothetical protein
MVVGLSFDLSLRGRKTYWPVPQWSGKIDLKDVNRILDAWSKEADSREGKYWDMINDFKV